jgi:glycosyltransferase involved in cell wall biosynthesis
MDPAVVVPAYNEASQLRGLLEALARQTDDKFTLYLVDNASDDDTAAIAREFRAPFPVQVLYEPARGIGPAVDTGFRTAIADGARWLLRTDADCLPAPDWVATARRLMTGDTEMLCGASVLRPDEHPTIVERTVLPLMSWAGRRAVTAARRAESRRTGIEPEPYFFIHGHNIAMTADLYVRCGGTPRERMIDGVDDTQLLDRARACSKHIAWAGDMVVAHSLRRERGWGLRRTILWQWDRRWSPATDDELHIR